MYRITGAFDNTSAAEVAIDALLKTGFKLVGGMVSSPTAESAACGTPNPEFGVPAVSAESPGVHDASKAAETVVALGGVNGFIIGLSAPDVLGPAGSFAGFPIGSYDGSLIGAVNGLSPAHSASTTDVAIEDEGPGLVQIERGESSRITILAQDNTGEEIGMDILWSSGASKVTVAD